MTSSKKSKTGMLARRYDEQKYTDMKNREGFKATWTQFAAGPVKFTGEDFPLARQ